MSAIKDVFISWNHKDKDLLNRVCEVLELNFKEDKNIRKKDDYFKLEYYNSEFDTNGNVNKECIENAKKSKVLLLLLTKNSINSNWVEKEINVFKEKNDYNIVCVSNVKIELQDELISKYEEKERIGYGKSAKRFIQKNTTQVIIENNEITSDNAFQILEKVNNSIIEYYINYYKKECIKEIEDNNKIIERKNINNVTGYFKYHNGILLTGKPAMGKTTQMKIYNNELADIDGYIPVFFQAKELCSYFKNENKDDNLNTLKVEISKRFKSIFDFEIYKDEIIINHIFRFNSIKNIVLIIDSFDEIKDITYIDNFIKSIQDLIKSSDSKYKAILSSRDFENSDTFTGFEKINLEMFNKDERKQYIDFYQCGEEEINKIEYKCKDIKTPFELKLKLDLYNENHDINIFETGFYEILKRYYFDSLDSDIRNFLSEYSYNSFFSNEEKSLFNALKGKYTDPNDRANIITKLKNKLIIKSDEKNIIFYNKTIESFFAAYYCIEHDKRDYNKMLDFKYYHDILAMILEDNSKEEKEIKKTIKDVVLIDDKLNENWIDFLCESIFNIKEYAKMTLRFLFKKALNSNYNYLFNTAILYVVEKIDLYEDLYNKCYVELKHENPTDVKELLYKKIAIITCCLIESKIGFEQNGFFEIINGENSLRDIIELLNKDIREESVNLDSIYNDFYEKVYSFIIEKRKYYDFKDSLFWNINNDSKIIEYLDTLNNYNRGLLYIDNIEDYNKKDLSKTSHLIVFNKNNLNLNKNLFGDNNTLKSIYLIGFDNIPSEYFNNSMNLKYCGINCPTSELIIETEAFKNCFNLVNFSTNASVSVINESTFADCSSLYNLNVSGIRRINNSAFNGCKKLEVIDLNNVEVIEESAFRNCKNLSHLWLSNQLSIIPKSAFEGCEKLGKLNNGEKLGIDKIRDNSFANGTVYINNILDNIKNIPNYAFNNSTIIMDGDELVISNINEIGIQAFSNCSGSYNKIEKIKIINCSKISSKAFYKINKVKKIEIKNINKNIEIDTAAFAFCNSLEAVYIVANNIKISNFCYYECNNLRIVSLDSNSNNTEIGYAAFSFCYNLNVDRVAINGENIDESDISYDTLFYKNPDPDSNNYNLDFFNKCKEEVGYVREHIIKLTIDENIINKDIKDKNYLTFLNYKYYIKKIIFSDELSSIGDLKLNDCSSLESIDLPSYIEEISDKFFNNCTSLKNVDFNNCKIIGNYSFANTGFINLKLPITIEQVCEKAFYKSQIEEIHIYSTTTLNLNSLYGMDNLKKIIIHKNDNKTIDEIKENILNALGKYIYDIELVIDDKKYNIKKSQEVITEDVIISKEPFSRDGYKNILIDDLDIIKLECKNIIISGLEEIRKYLFYNNDKIEKIVIDKTVKRIGKNAFCGCKNLTSINLENVEEIEEYAFRDCEKLEYVDLSSHNEIINKNAFCNTGLLKIIFPENLNEIKGSAFEGCKIESINIKNSKGLYIKNHAFSSCANLKKINISDSESINIEFESFNNCKNIEFLKINSKYKSHIYSKAFDADADIKTINIPNNIIIDIDAIPHNHNILKLNSKNWKEYIYWDEANRKYKIDNKVIIYNYSNLFIEKSFSQKMLKAFMNTSFYKIEFDSEITEIIDNAMSFINAKEIILPKKLIRIGNNAFSGNKLLKQIVIPDSVIEIGSKAFMNCTNLNRIKLPSNLEIISDSLFVDDVSLANIQLPSNLKEIHKYAFKNTRIEKLEFFSNLELIEEQVFEDSTLKIIDLSMTKLKNISDSLFKDTKYLEEVKLPETLISIGNCSFENSNISSLNLPVNLSEIGDYAFYDSNICDINLNKITKVGESCFENCKKLCNVNLDSLEKASKCSFRNTGIKKVELNEKFNILNDELFRSCNNLIEVNLKAKNITIGKRCFSYDIHLREINLNNVLRVEEKAFIHCELLLNVNLNNANFIGYSAFAFNTGLKIFNANSLEKLDNEIFYGCNKLEKISMVNIKEVTPDFLKNCTDNVKKIDFSNVDHLDSDFFKNINDNIEVVVSDSFDINSINHKYVKILQKSDDF